MRPFYKVPLLVPVFLCAVLQVPAQAQALTASTRLVPVANYTPKESNLKPLTTILSELESRYQVSFNYDSKLLSTKYANQEVVRASQGSVEVVLASLLPEQKLRAEKINRNTYLILPFTQQTSMMQDLIVVKAVKAAAVTVSGKVTDENGEGLPGVTVALQGTSIGATTDINGNFTIAVPDGQENGTLAISYIGYVTQQVPINNRSTINIQLAPDVKALEEVVVIGYQTVRKQDLTGAAAVINPEQANKVTAASVAESVQGLAPGVTVRNSGAPGSGATIDIRGVASFTNTAPLYVIDGMIADANPTINTNDIESIQILKDASAAAIYGSRAANGVIIITTKKGKEGPAKIAVSAKYGLQQIPKRWDVMNSADFAATQRQQYINSGLTPPASVGDAFDPTIDTDWQDETTRLGTLEDYNVTLSGGSATGNYLISGSYFNNKGVLVNNVFDRASLRVNTQGEKGRLTFGENLVLSYSTSEYPLLGNAFYDMPQLLPVIRVRDESYIDPGANNPGGWGIGNPITAPSYAWNYIAIGDLFNSTHNFTRAVGNAYVGLKLFDWLDYKFNAGLDGSFDFNQNLRKQGNWVLAQAFETNHVYQNRQRWYSILLEHTLNFNKTFGQHNINGVVGYTQQSGNRDIIEARRNDLQVFGGRYFTTISSAIGDQTSEGRVLDDYRLHSTLGRLNYTYADKYLLTFTGRYDQDSRFGANNRNGFFPSVAVGWRVSEESFFNAPWVTDLKLRASYGELGINTVGSWDYIPVITNNPRAVFGPEQVPFVGAYQAQLTNTDLRWETRISKNIGLDASFLNNKLSVTAEYYNSLSKDVLVQLPVAFYLGNLGGDPFINAGSIRNTGVEFSATYRSAENPFKWDVSGNFTTIKNKVEDIGNLGEGINYLQVGATRSQIGRGIGEWYVIKTNGLFQSQSEIDNYVNSDGTVIQPLAKPGDVRFVDLNDDGQINNDDRTFVGSPWPTLQTGAQFNASYRNFSFNLQLIGVFGYKVFNDVRRILDSYQNTNFRSDISPWTPQNTNTTDPRLGRDTDPGISSNNRYESDRWLEDASYVRIRNIELGYTLPPNLLGLAHVQNARIYISGQNLLTFTGYSGLDPDVTGNGILQRGVDAGNWPASRVYSIGLDFGF